MTTKIRVRSCQVTTARHQAVDVAWNATFRVNKLNKEQWMQAVHSQVIQQTIPTHNDIIDFMIENICSIDLMIDYMINDLIDIILDLTELHRERIQCPHL